jgi:hypothetical protein
MLLHLAVPAGVARLAYPQVFLKAWLVMMAAMLIDLDHLVAEPMYDPGRCSIGFHPLHQYPVIALFALAAAWPKTRMLGIGLLIHVFLDGIDCWWMQYES